MAFRILQRLSQEILNAAGVRLIDGAVRTEGLVEDLQEVFRVQAVAQIGDKTYVLLSSAT
jgi:hypothetical protein